jgi:surface antigen
VGKTYQIEDGRNDLFRKRGNGMDGRRVVVMPVLLLALLAACASMGPKETAGTAIGAGGGAIIGSQIGGGSGRLVGVAIGTLAGALIGQEVGRSLDQQDQLEMQRTAQYALENNRTDEPSAWRNPDSGHAGEIKPVKTYRNPQGRYCREYVQTVSIGGEPRQAYGRACRQPDGSWKIVN